MLIIKSVSVMPNPVNTGEKILIRIDAELTTYERLKLYIHRALKKFTHKNLAQDKLTKEI